MANENNEISDIVKKCKILLLDIEGTTTSISFVKDKLFPYAEENVKEFLDAQWDNDDVKEVVTALRKLAIEDQEKSVEGAVAIPGEDASKEDQIKALVESVKWQMSQDRKVSALKQLQGLIWKQGYDKGDIKGHVYDDVSPALKLWRSVDGQKVYIYSSGSVQAQKLLFGQSLAGDMLPLIDGHFDTAVGAKQEATSYTAIAEKIGCKSEEILFLTDIVKEAEAARSSGMQVALMSREGNAPLPEEATVTFPVLHSFDQLANTNKRKPPSQDEQPAKVLKTDTEADVKSSAENMTLAEEPPKSDAEKMDVEPTEKVEKSELAAVIVAETVVEEITDVNEVADTPICDIEPVVEENVENTDKKEAMETDTTEESSKAQLPEKKPKMEAKGEIKAPVAEETPPAVITEIEELSDDKQTLSEVAEIIEDLQPVVEEPPVIDEIDDLQNVGEVLGKECDEILSKVQDVTNLDNLPLKPLLNTIAEETMETENTDSNDIVDRILDTEMELGMKPCDDIKLNKNVEISSIKTLIEEENSAKNEENIKGKLPDDKPTECITAELKDSVVKKAENSTGATVEDVKVDVKEINNETEENKMETEENEEEIIGNKITSAGEMPKEVSDSIDNKAIEENKINIGSKKEVSSNKTDETGETTEAAGDKMDVVKSKIDVAEIKTDTLENKTDVVANKTEVVENKNKDIENKVEAVDNKTEIVDNIVEVVERENEVQDRMMDVEEKGAVDTEVKTDEPATESKVPPTESSVVSTGAKDVSTETKENVSVTEEDKAESNVTIEPQLNGKTTNGEAEAVNLNGDAKDEELSSRLSVENGKEEVNGSNGDSNDADKAQADNKMETEIAEIKVKSVATDEPISDPIEQPTEA